MKAHQPSLKKTDPSRPQAVRIIGGRWKRRLLPIPSQSSVRPTPNRVRETLFNWLGQSLDGRHCVDAFAGTGAVGLEAASRGAASVLLIEQNPALVTHLHKAYTLLQASPNAPMAPAGFTPSQSTQIEIIRGNALLNLAALPAASVDVLFLDPPFDQTALYTAALAQATRLLKPQGLVYLEAAQAWEDKDLATQGLAMHRQGRAGRVWFHLLRRA